MPDGGASLAIAGGLAGGSSILASRSASKASSKANRRALAYEAQRYQDVRSLLMPFLQQGQAALGPQARLLGLRGRAAEEREISRLERSPIFSSLSRQGEQAILQNAAATGGLRGGNTQEALAQFRPQLLNTFLNERIMNLGNVVGQGQDAAGAVGGTSDSSGGRMSALRSQIGQDQAGGILGMAQGVSNAFGQYMQHQQLQSLLNNGGHDGNGAGGGTGLPNNMSPSSIQRWRNTILN